MRPYIDRAEVIKSMLTPSASSAPSPVTSAASGAFCAFRCRCPCCVATVTRWSPDAAAFTCGCVCTQLHPRPVRAVAAAAMQEVVLAAVLPLTTQKQQNSALLSPVLCASY